MWTAVLTALSKRLWQHAEFLRSTSEGDKKVPKIIISLNGSFRHVEYSSDNPSEKILDKNPKMLHSVSGRDWKDEIYSGKSLSSKCSSGRVKRKFDNTVQSLSRKNQEKFAQALKMPKKGFQNWPLLKLFQWSLRMCLWQTWRIFLPDGKIFLSEIPIVRNKTVHSFPKNFQLEVLLETKNAVFTNQWINIGQNPKKFLLIVRKWWEESQRIPLPKMILLSSGMQFWQSSQTTFEKSGNFPSLSEKISTVFIGKCFC